MARRLSLPLRTRDSPGIMFCIEGGEGNTRSRDLSWSEKTIITCVCLGPLAVHCLLTAGTLITHSLAWSCGCIPSAMVPCIGKVLAFGAVLGLLFVTFSYLALIPLGAWFCIYGVSAMWLLARTRLDLTGEGRGESYSISIIKK